MGSAAKAASEKAATLQTGASNAALNAQRAADKAKKEAAEAAKQEAVNEDRVLVQKNLAQDAEKSANAAKDAADKAEALSNGIAKQLHDAKCDSHSGCSALQGYCCPTFDVSRYHLGESPKWGVTLGCCSAAATEALTVATVETQQSFGGLTMLFSSVLSAAIGGVMAVKIGGRGNDGVRDYQSLSA